MAIKTFTTGEVLTASDTNTFLANSGLVYVTSTTVGTGVSNVTLNNVFSSTYDAYEILINGGTGNGDYGFDAQLGSTTTGYYASGFYVNFNGTTVTNAYNNISYMPACAILTTDTAAGMLRVINPYLAKRTYFWSNYVYGQTSGGGGSQGTGGYLNNATSYTSIKFTVGGTMTGVTFTVYGYRKA